MVARIHDLLQDGLEHDASDIQLIVDAPPVFRIHGEVHFVDGDALTPEETKELFAEIMTREQRAELAQVGDIDFAYALPDGTRFRVNVYKQQGTIAGVLRVIPSRVPRFEELGLPAVIPDFVRKRRGLVLVTGATGSGKSTTLAALIRIINEERRCHVVTVEDPIEFLHDHGDSVVSQREVGTDTESFAEALRHVLRQAPDVILVGEMRDLETTAMALTAAETGHLVLSTLHTNDAVQTIDRIIDIFPQGQQGQIRQQLSSTLIGVVCQELLPRRDGKGRVAATEVMVATSGVRNLIRENKSFQLRSLIQTGQDQGMRTLEQSLAELVREGEIGRELAFEVCNDDEDLENQL